MRRRSPLLPLTPYQAHGNIVYILEELFQLGRLRKNQGLLDRVHAMKSTMVIIPLAKKMSYLFPLSFNRRTIERAGAGDCHARPRSLRQLHAGST